MSKFFSKRVDKLIAREILILFSVLVLLPILSSLIIIPRAFYQDSKYGPFVQRHGANAYLLSEKIDSLVELEVRDIDSEFRDQFRDLKSRGVTASEKVRELIQARHNENSSKRYYEQKMGNWDNYLSQLEDYYLVDFSGDPEDNIYYGLLVIALIIIYPVRIVYLILRWAIKTVQS